MEEKAKYVTESTDPSMEEVQRLREIVALATLRPYRAHLAGPALIGVVNIGVVNIYLGDEIDDEDDEDEDDDNEEEYGYGGGA